MANKGKRRAWKTILICVLTALGVLALTVASYVSYVFLAYHRLEDNIELDIKGSGFGEISTGVEYKLLSFNIGFGAYEPDYGFFMDGGKESRAWSYDRLTANIKKIGEYVQSLQADFICMQEVDTNGTRTYHYNERDALSRMFPDYSSVFAQNYDSPYLFYPFLKPIGANRSGLLSLSRYAPQSAVRYSLPIESGVRKLLDLDRCYSVSRYALQNGREFVLVNLHLSAYTADGTISDEQVEMIADAMKAEYEKGNYVVCAGDFNKNLLSAEEDPFNATSSGLSWAKYFPVEKLNGTGISLVAPLDPEHPVPSCRNADGPYTPDQLVITIDGFLVSGNVTIVSAAVEDTAFAYSDHNPVSLTFILQEQ